MGSMVRHNGQKHSIFPKTVKWNFLNLTQVIINDNLMTMKWTITFYNEKVESITLAFPKGILANLLRIFDLIECYGPAIGKPHTAPMGRGMFEIRAKGKEGIGRSLFCSVEGQEIVILHSFIKKTNKTPKKDLDLALKRMKELKYGTSNL